MNDTFMKERPVFPLLLSMALPMAISMLVNSLYNIVDAYYVAEISDDAMTALSLVFPVQNLINAVAIGFGIGLNAVVSRRLGEGAVRRGSADALLFGDVHPGGVCAGAGSALCPDRVSLRPGDVRRHGL